MSDLLVAVCLALVTVAGLAFVSAIVYDTWREVLNRWRRG